MSRWLAVLVLAAAAAAPAQEWKSEQSKWESVGLNAGGGLFNPSVSPHDARLILTESDMGGRYASRDGGAEWRMYHYMNISASCRGGPVLFHPTEKDVLYATSQHTANVLHVSTDGGRTWAKLPPDRQPKVEPQEVIRRMYIDPARPQRLFVGTANGNILFTDDEGANWQKAAGVSGSVIKFVALAGKPVSPGAAAGPGEVRTYFVGTGAGVFKSADGGKTWTKTVKGLPEGKGIRGFAGGSNEKAAVLYVSTATWVEDDKLQGGAYVSTDRGQSWQRAMNPDLNVQTKRSSQWAGDIATYGHFVANDVKPERAYVWGGGTSYFPPNHNTVYRTDDAGQTWKAVWFVDPRMKECNVAKDWMTNYMWQSWVGGPISMEISPTDPDMVMRTDGMFMFSTRDGGANWIANHAVRAKDGPKDEAPKPRRVAA